MAATSKITDTAHDITEQLADLRAQLDHLIDKKALPMIHDARDTMRDGVDAFSGQVRSQPIAAIAITAAVAFLAGRLFR